MIARLIPFSHDLSSEKIKVEVSCKREYIEITYHLSSLDNIVIEEWCQPSRMKGLWEKTCFEAFILNSKTQEYFEFNRSFHGDWNVFYFPYRGAELREFPCSKAPLLENKLNFVIYKNFFGKKFWVDQQMRIGLSAVIKDSQAQLSYWALSHEESRPNFHHFNSFKLIF